MAAPADDSSPRDLLERLVLAGIGAAALTGDRADQLADELAARGAVRRDEVRETIEELTRRWRGDAIRIGERAGASLEGLFHELGLVTKREHDELELRVAQLEHRLRLVESAPTGVSLLSRVFPPLWDEDKDRLWDLMRAFVPQITLALAPSYAYGVERLPVEGGVLVAANHFSGIDHPLIGAFSPRPLYFMAKAELFEIPVIGEILGWTNTFPIRRGEADREGVRRARELVREGKAVVVHIEGTRQPFGHPGPIQRGALLIALAERVPVVPCAVDTFGWSPLNRRRCAVVFGEPLPLEGLPRGRAGYDQAGRAVEAAIVSLWRQAVGAVRDGFPERLADGARRSGPFPRQGRQANLPH